MQSAAVVVSTLAMSWFVQPYLIAAGLEVRWFGVAWAILYETVGFAAYYAWRVEKRLDSKITILAIVAALQAGFLGMSLLPLFFGFSMLKIFQIYRGIATPTLRNYINLLTESGVRATVLSVRNFIIWMIFAILVPFLGFLTDAYNLKTALL
ncbi:MAG TPA: MFS transporter, partial [Bacteroidales bacterium]|nr:MFS transporter [Bacteroidales bacterium]